jgi:hypothetical protein
VSVEPGLTPPLALPVTDALELLSHGTLEVEGRVTTASNATLYCRVELDGIAAAAVYKPVAGERPLWDYPDGTLAERERATYLLAAATGWDPVPPTVLRDGPMGTGMVQLWVDEDPTVDIIAAINSGESEALQRLALLDAVINNSDRKVSHLIPAIGPDGRARVYGVDHGVSLGVEDKLRTVLWQWAGVRIPDPQHEMLVRLREHLRAELSEHLAELLTMAEVRAVNTRVELLLGSRLFPLPPTDWPAVPYPPY